jgi:hypothetical protein
VRWLLQRVPGETTLSADEVILRERRRQPEMSNDQDNSVIKRRSSIMLAFFTMLYREYCRARLAEMRK